MRTTTVLLLILLTSRVVAQNPQPRHWEEIVFDPQRKVLIMFGGGEPDFLGNNPQKPNNIFEWNANGWKSYQPANSPEGIDAHALLYNTREKVTVLIGGALKFADDGSTLGVWTWNGKVWKQLTA